MLFPSLNIPTYIYNNIKKVLKKLNVRIPINFLNKFQYNGTVIYGTKLRLQSKRSFIIVKYQL